MVDGLSLDQLARTEAVHRATAARRLQKVRAQVVSSVRRLLTARLKLSPSELESLVRLARSQLDLSLPPIKADR